MQHSYWDLHAGSDEIPDWRVTPKESAGSKSREGTFA